MGKWQFSNTGYVAQYTFSDLYIPYIQGAWLDYTADKVTELTVPTT
jgi:hypothetical protein